MRNRRTALAQDDQLPGGLADDMPDSDFDPEQLKMGVEVEMEHTDDPKLAEEIARDHLAEIPDYYTRLKKMEDKAESARAAVARKARVIALLIRQGRPDLANKVSAAPALAADEYKWLNMLGDSNALVKYLTDDLADSMRDGHKRAENAKKTYGGGEIFAANWIEDVIVKEQFPKIRQKMENIEKNVRKQITERWGRMGKAGAATAAVSKEAQGGFKELQDRVLARIIRKAIDEAKQVLEDIVLDNKYPNQQIEYAVDRHKPMKMPYDEWRDELADIGLDWLGDLRKLLD